MDTSFSRGTIVIPNNCSHGYVSWQQNKSYYVLLCTCIHVKTNLIEAPIQWSTSPLMLHRTTAECLWRGLRRCPPVGPWTVDQINEMKIAKWVVFVYIGDEASANRRLVQQAMKRAASLREHVVSIWCPCFLHVLHREGLSVAFIVETMLHR